MKLYEAAISLRPLNSVGQTSCSSVSSCCCWLASSNCQELHHLIILPAVFTMLDAEDVDVDDICLSPGFVVELKVCSLCSHCNCTRPNQRKSTGQPYRSVLTLLLQFQLLIFLLLSFLLGRATHWVLLVVNGKWIVLVLHLSSLARYSKHFTLQTCLYPYQIKVDKKKCTWLSHSQ